jgi:SAM-dependent methyltransferase
VSEPYVVRLPVEVWEWCKEAGRTLDANPIVHPEDYMFSFIIKMGKTPRQGVFDYFQGGDRTARMLAHLVRQCLAQRVESAPTMLEFASGYGRMTRHLIRHLPEVELSCCDIHEQAVQFTRQVLGVRTVLSSSLPADLTLNETYDVISAISFFSHVPDSTFKYWLKALFDRLKLGGHLIFTTHGRSFMRRVAKDLYTTPEIPACGFFFAPTSEQQDIDSSQYGAMFVTQEYVANQFMGLPADGLHFQEGVWSGQDLYVVQRLHE